jgi:homopolymeric O-antigen transport system permease protein
MPGRLGAAAARRAAGRARFGWRRAPTFLIVSTGRNQDRIGEMNPKMTSELSQWRNRWFLLENLILKDFRIRYRNMSLGVAWSVVNPLVMMGILTLVFTKVFPNNSQPHFAVFVLCGLVPFNFYSLALNAGTTSLLDNNSLIKRVRCPREVFPIAAVLANCLHFLIQIALLIIFVLAVGYRINAYWLWLVPIWGLEIAFMCGLALITSGLDVYYRDIRYLVEVSGLVLFWLVPIFYTLEMVPANVRSVYVLNPISAVILAEREPLLLGKAPSLEYLMPLVIVTAACVTLGFLIFGRLKQNLADYL